MKAVELKAGDRVAIDIGGTIEEGEILRSDLKPSGDVRTFVVMFDALKDEVDNKGTMVRPDHIMVRLGDSWALLEAVKDIPIEKMFGDAPTLALTDEVLKEGDDGRRGDALDRTLDELKDEADERLGALGAREPSDGFTLPDDVKLVGFTDEDRDAVGRLAVRMWAHKALRLLIVDASAVNPSVIQGAGGRVVVKNTGRNLGISMEALELFREIKQPQNKPGPIDWRAGVFSWTGGGKAFLDVDELHMSRHSNIPDADGYSVIPNEPPPEALQVLEDIEKQRGLAVRDAAKRARAESHSGLIVKIFAHVRTRTLVIEGDEGANAPEWKPIAPGSMGCLLMNLEERLGVSAEALELLGELKEAGTGGVADITIAPTAIGMALAWIGRPRRFIDVAQSSGRVAPLLEMEQGVDFQFVPNDVPRDALLALEELERGRRGPSVDGPAKPLEKFEK